MTDIVLVGVLNQSLCSAPELHSIFLFAAWCWILQIVEICRPNT